MKNIRLDMVRWICQADEREWIVNAAQAAVDECQRHRVKSLGLEGSKGSKGPLEVMSRRAPRLLTHMKIYGADNDNV